MICEICNKQSAFSTLFVTFGNIGKYYFSVNLIKDILIKNPNNLWSNSWQIT